MFGGRGKISDLMGDVAKGIKAFKKGMADEDTAEAARQADAPMKTIDHQAARRSQAARRGREQGLARPADARALIATRHAGSAGRAGAGERRAGSFHVRY